MSSLVIWDNPGARAEFPRALPGVLAFLRELPALSTESLRALRAKEISKEPPLFWKVSFIDAELERREAARRVLAADSTMGPL